MSKEKDLLDKAGYLGKIRSKYILKSLFEYLPHIKMFKLINHNKTLQGLLKVNLIDYKKEFLKIVIDIIPSENINGEIIAISKQYESYYHIYFNDSKIETKNKKITWFDKIKKIKIVLDYKIKSLIGIFKKCKCIKQLKFIKFNRDDITNMSEMFEGCSSLEKLDHSILNSNNLNNMSYMFSVCSTLKKLIISNFNTNNLLDVSYMFNRCNSLEE